MQYAERFTIDWLLLLGLECGADVWCRIGREQ